HPNINDCLVPLTKGGSHDDVRVNRRHAFGGLRNRLYCNLSLSNREEKKLKTLGYFLGVFIMLLSGMLLLGNLFLASRYCPIMGKMKMKMMPRQEIMHRQMRVIEGEPIPAPKK
ncbi:MAG: hypothetical protein WC658_00670, partial [Candidatus Omnitrophota bacterium]